MSEERKMNDVEKLLQEIKKISYIRPQEVPNIDLYMDQVTTFMDQHLESTKRYSEDKLLTKTMINNYTKNNLLPSPQKKKYSKDHMYLLMYIYYLKNFLSITDIQAILHPLSEMFFGNKGEIDLESIYQEIYQTEREQSVKVAKDIVRKFTDSQNTFSQIENEEQREYLKKFSYICMLSYDIYMKRQMLERMIDQEFLPKEDEKDAKKEKEQPEQKQESKKKQQKEQEKEQEKEQVKEETKEDKNEQTSEQVVENQNKQ